MPIMSNYWLLTMMMPVIGFPYSQCTGADVAWWWRLTKMSRQLRLNNDGSVTKIGFTSAANEAYRLTTKACNSIYIYIFASTFHIILRFLPSWHSWIHSFDFSRVLIMIPSHFDPAPSKKNQLQLHLAKGWLSKHSLMDVSQIPSAQGLLIWTA